MGAAGVCYLPIRVSTYYQQPQRGETQKSESLLRSTDALESLYTKIKQPITQEQEINYGRKMIGNETRHVQTLVLESWTIKNPVVCCKTDRTQSREWERDWQNSI